MASAPPTSKPEKVERPVETRPAQGATLGLPTGSAAGTGALSVNATDFPYAWYLRQVVQKVEAEWKRQNRMSEPSQRPLLYFEIQRNGSIKLPKLKESSGNATYDQAALRAVVDASPVPAAASGLGAAVTGRRSQILPEQSRMSVRPARPLLLARGRRRSPSSRAACCPPLPGPPEAPGRPTCCLNVIASGAKKLNIAIPDFTLAGGADPHALVKRVPEVLGNDLNFSAIFSVVGGTPALPANNPAAVREAWAGFAAAGAHAGLHGLSPTAAIGPKSRCACTT